MDKNIEKKQHAQLLYITQGKSHAEIAAEVGVSERTVFTWVHQYAWDKLRLAAYQAPVSIANKLCEEIAELQQNIATRDAGQRFPTPHESLTMQRMVSCLDKMKKYPSLSQNMQVLESFKNYIKPLDKDFSKTLGNYTNRYLSSAAQNGFVPYQLEYGVDAAPPLAPYYEEEEIGTDEPSVSTWQPDSPINYTIPGLHHARPYLVPLMHICYDQLVEDQQRAEALAEYYEQHCSTTDTTPEIVSSSNQRSKTPVPQQAGEVISIENNTENTLDSQHRKAKASGLSAEAPAKGGSKTPTLQQPKRIIPTGKPYISPRLENILSELARSDREAYATGYFDTDSDESTKIPPEVSGSRTEDDSTEDNDSSCDESTVTYPEVSGSKTEADPIKNNDIDGNDNAAIIPEASGSKPEVTPPVIPPNKCDGEIGSF